MTAAVEWLLLLQVKPRHSLSAIESPPTVSSSSTDASSSVSRQLHYLPLVTTSVATTRFNQLSPILAVPPFEGVGRRRCSSPGAFLHMIREDEAVRWDVDEGVGGDVGRRKTSFVLDDICSPVQPICELAWSRKTSATSGYSESMVGGDVSWSSESRKTSLIDDDRLGTSPDRAACSSDTVSQFYQDEIAAHLAPPPTVGPRPSVSVPTFQLVVDDADVSSQSRTDGPDVATASFQTKS